MTTEQWAKLIVPFLFGGSAAGVFIALINQAFSYKNNRASAYEKQNEAMLEFWQHAETKSREERNVEMADVKEGFREEIKKLSEKHSAEMKAVNDNAASERSVLSLTIERLNNEQLRMAEDRGKDNLKWEQKYNEVILRMERKEREILQEKLEYTEGILERFEGFCREIVEYIERKEKESDSHSVNDTSPVSTEA